MTPRLKTDIWAAAYVRRCAVDNVPVYIVRKGDPDAGAVYVRINLLDGRSRLIGAHLGPEGERAWSDLVGEGPVADEIAEGFLERARARDPDLWIIEVEDRAGLTRLEGF